MERVIHACMPMMSHHGSNFWKESNFQYFYSNCWPSPIHRFYAQNNHVRQRTNHQIDMVTTKVQVCSGYVQCRRVVFNENEYSGGTKSRSSNRSYSPVQTLPSIWSPNPFMYILSATSPSVTRRIVSKVISVSKVIVWTVSRRAFAVGFQTWCGSTLSSHERTYKAIHSRTLRPIAKWRTPMTFWLPSLFYIHNKYNSRSLPGR